MSIKIKKTLFLFLIMSVLLTSINLYAAAESPKMLYKSAQESYRAKKNKEALRIFVKFRKEYPSNKKADDALWYIGRIYKRMDKVEKAIDSFTMLLDLPKRSNRFSEASYDLARIFYQQKKYTEAISLLDPLKKEEDPGNFDLRLLRLLAKSHYSRGRRMLKIDRKELAEEDFLEAERIYTLLFDFDKSSEKRIDYLIGKAKSFRYLKRLARDNHNASDARRYRKSYKETLKMALTLNKDEKREKYIYRMLGKSNSDKRRTSDEKFLYGLDVDLLAKTNRMDDEIGGYISVASSLKTPIKNGKRYRLSGRYKHDDFSVKTFNFLDDEISDEKARLIQRTDRFSISADRYTGLISPLKSRLRLTGSSLLAEDDGDNYIYAGISEKIEYEFADNKKLAFLASFSWKKYPDYLVSGRKLDSIRFKAAPDLTWYMNKSRSLNFAYSYYFKQYLDSKYYQNVKDAKGEYLSAEKDKRYETHSFVIKLKNNKRKSLRSSMWYTLSINETGNYDNDIKAKNVNGIKEDRFVKDYYDFIEHSFDIGIDFLISERMKLDFEGTYSIRDFKNYPARDKTNTFIDENRQDIAFELDADAQYLISKRKQNKFADIFANLQISYNKQSSNMKYEKSFDTNYDVFSIMGGLSLILF